MTSPTVQATQIRILDAAAADAFGLDDGEVSEDQGSRSGSAVTDVDSVFDRTIDRAGKLSLLPGGLVGFSGVVLAVMAIVSEIAADPLTDAEFVASLVVAALLAIAGPVVAAFATASTNRAATDVKVASEERAEAEERRRAAQIRAYTLRREYADGPGVGG